MHQLFNSPVHNTVEPMILKGPSEKRTASLERTVHNDTFLDLREESRVDKMAGPLLGGSTVYSI